MINRAQMLLTSETLSSKELGEILNEMVDEYDKVDLIPEVNVYIIDDMEPE